MYCRLGFAKKKGMDQVNQDDLHPSWRTVEPVSKKITSDQIILDWDEALVEANRPVPDTEVPVENTVPITLESVIESNNQLGGANKRIAFLFDSTLTAFLMMGNLSPGLKSHAVTMFEVGKLSDESLDSFLSELEKVGSEAEGEARRYFVHALTLRDTLKFLRYNKDLNLDPENSSGLAVDLIRCESLLSLEPAARARVLNKNYNLLISMAPLSYEIKPVTSCTPQHIGPAIPEVNSVWFKLFVYQLTGSGPPSLLLVKGTKLRQLPKMFHDYDRLLVTTWGHDPGVISTSNILITLNDALTHSAVMVQAHGWQSDGKMVRVAFPLDKDKKGAFCKSFQNHGAIQKLCSNVDLEHTCGYVTLLNTGKMSRTVFYEEEEEEFFQGPLESNEIDYSDEGTASPESPHNGLKDKACAAVLASEIDSIDSELFPSPERTEVQKLKDKMSLDLDKQGEGQNEVSPDQLKEDDWVLLDCNFGIPLFDSSLNKEVCTKILNEGLFKIDSLEELLHSSRKLSLRLLHFISQNQDSVGLGDITQDPLLPPGVENDDQISPFPTVNLVFNEGKLQRWNKR